MLGPFVFQVNLTGFLAGLPFIPFKDGDTHVMSTLLTWALGRGERQSRATSLAREMRIPFVSLDVCSSSSQLPKLFFR